MAQYRMNETDQKFKVRIESVSSKSREVVEAPLPENFGVTVGSEFSAPFDGNLIQGTLAKVAALQGMAKKTGTSGTKMYSNPEPSEISFELEFEAYYSALEEVVMPVGLLMTMALGTGLTIDDLEASMQKFVNKSLSMVGREASGEEESEGSAPNSEAEGYGDRILELIGFIQGPRRVSVKFGNTLRLPAVWISSVSPQFSNVLDPNGYPMSATVSVTCALQKEPVVEDVNEWFVGAVGGAVSVREKRIGRQEGLIE